MLRKIIFPVIGILLTACEDANHAVTISEQQNRITSLQDSVVVLQDSLNQLRESRTTLLEELNRYKTAPEKIASNVDQLYKDGNISELNRISKMLQRYHPESKEAGIVAGLVTRYEADQRAKAEAEREAKRGALKKLKIKYDNVQNITWYYNNRFTHYNNSNHTSIYMGQHGDKGDVWLRLKMSYEGDDWIFFEHAYLSYDGNTIEIPFEKYKEKESDNGYGGRVWEWIDVNVDSSILLFLSEMVEGKEVKMRLSGKYSKTRIIPSSEISAIKEVLLGYELLQDPNNR